MENFQLREGSSRRTNSAFRNLSNNTCRSFISTALGSDSAIGGEELRKSRIQNLPNYKKSSLGDNVHFIVVFQTIEIERLSQEVELLRMKIRQNERQLFNAQNYEVQIRELTEKCFHYQQQMGLYTEQIQKLNKIAQNLYNENESIKQKFEEMSFAIQQREGSYRQKNQELQQEIDRWKNRSQAIERNKSKDLEELKSLMENQRKSVVDRQMKEISIRHQNEKSALQNQIRKCRQLLNNKNSQIEELKKKNDRLQSRIKSLQAVKDSVASSENKIMVLSGDLNRANEILKSRDQQMLNFKKKETVLNNKLRDHNQLENDYNYLKGVVQNRTKQLEDVKVKLSSYEDEALRSKQMVHLINQLQDKLTFSANQINRLSSVLKGKIEENQKIKSKFMERQNEHSRLKNLQNQMAQSEAKFNMIRAENDRINGTLKTRLQEIDSWKRKYNQLDSVTTRYSLLERDKKNLQQKYNNQLKEGQQLKFMITKLDTQNGELRKLQKSYGEQANKNNLLSKQLDRLNNIIKNNMEDLTSSKMRYSKMQESIKNYQDKMEYIHQYENRIKLLVAENQRLNNLISDKNEDIESLQSSKIDMITKINHYKNYEVKNNQYENICKKLNENVEGLNKELEAYKNKCRGYQNKIRDMENNVNFTQQEKERLNGLNKNKNSQIQEYKNKCSKLEQQCRKKAELDLVCQELHGQVLVYLGELQATQKKYKQYEQAYIKEKKQNGEFVKKIAVMSKEIDNLTRQMNNRDNSKIKQIDTLQQSVKSHLQKVKEKDQEVHKLMDKINKLERECEKIIKEFNKLVAIVENNQRETLTLNQKIEQYKDYAKRIHILAAQLDRLSTLNRGLQDDNKKMRLKYSDHIDFEKRQQNTALMVVLMSAQIQSLRERADKREMNLDEMRKSILEPLKKV